MKSEVPSTKAPVACGCRYYSALLKKSSPTCAPFWPSAPSRPGLPYIRDQTRTLSKGSVRQLMDDLDLINSVEQVEVMVNSIQKGAENQKILLL